MRKKELNDFLLNFIFSKQRSEKKTRVKTNKSRFAIKILISIFEIAFSFTNVVKIFRSENELFSYLKNVFMFNLILFWLSFAANI